MTPISRKPASDLAISRLRVVIRGAVQGVGFRPFVYRLANELGLTGWVRNSGEGVVLEAEGHKAAQESLLLRLAREKPPRSSIQSLESSWLDPIGFHGFEITRSHTSGPPSTLILPDIAVCEDCLREMWDPSDRRYLYPFTNCTNCGPRFSIIESLPYDRPNTSMRRFRMCSECEAEYHDPSDRRFHAQPNACPKCGPRLEFWNSEGNCIAKDSEHSVGGETASFAEATLSSAAQLIQSGRVLALKGLGGFHLMVAADDAEAVRRLRQRKHREEKPFAVMFPSLEMVRANCHASAFEERLLLAAESPIVLLQRKEHESSTIAAEVAPGNPNLGAMLPYTPLHHLLLRLLNVPVVATSGNLSDEPICIDERQAVERLRGIADGFLVHNRPIVRHVDDSVVRVVAGREAVLRRARGYAPLPIFVQSAATEHAAVLAVGAHLKNAVALAKGPQIFISQHIGDLESAEAYDAFQRVAADFQKLYEMTPQVIAADAHPDYLSSKFARQTVENSPSPAPKLVLVQHHLAHVYSCIAENELRGPVLGVAWDGTGYGLDGAIWGGEYFVVDGARWERVAHMRYFPLPGGNQAIKEPRRSALGLLFAALGENAFLLSELEPLKAFSAPELNSLKTMLQRQLHSPLTSSVGRLFDALSSLAGLRQHTRFEGQAAMELEFAIQKSETNDAYAFELQTHTRPYVQDWTSLVQQAVADSRNRVPAGMISAKLHNGLVESIINVARRVGVESIALSGGCFQNKYLIERAVQRLRQEGFRPYWHQRVPPNDGGIALGQVMAVRQG